MFQRSGAKFLRTDGARLLKKTQQIKKAKNWKMSVEWIFFWGLLLSVVVFLIVLICLVQFQKISFGAQGVQSNNAAVGWQGLHGVQSNIGDNGAQGTFGLQGYAQEGAQGLASMDGAQGEDGLQGTQGPDGILGFQGAPTFNYGPQGLMSNQVGSQGTVGNMGSVGSQGLFPFVFATTDALTSVPLTGSIIAPRPLLKGSSTLDIWSPGTTYKLYFSGSLAQNSADLSQATATFQLLQNGSAFVSVGINLPDIGAQDNANYQYNASLEIVSLTATSTRVNSNIVCQYVSGTLGYDFVTSNTVAVNHAAIAAPFDFDVNAFTTSTVTGQKTNIFMVMVV
jgi:hypothetical protein